MAKVITQVQVTMSDGLVYTITSEALDELSPHPFAPPFQDVTMDQPPAPQTPAPLREAAPEEAATIQELAQAVGLALLRAWDGRPAEQRASLSMTLSCCAALAHSLGRLIAAAPKEDITAEQWAAWVEQNAQMVRETADEARRQRDAVGDDVPPVMVAEPKFLM